MPSIDLPLAEFGEGTNYEAYRLFCPHIDKRGGKTGWTFRVWAPNAVAVSVVGDFNDWDAKAHPMKRIHAGVWERFVAGACEWQAYRYRVLGADGHLVDKTDPFALHCETPPASAGKLAATDDYVWHDQEWLARRAADAYSAPLCVYELHVGSWKTYPDGHPFSYGKLADELAPYLVQMHYTHVELMPLCEYPFADSWGYQCTGMFAPTSRYGAPKDLMVLVDRLHQAGIGVILDWVGAHFPKDSYGLARFDGTVQYEYAGKKGEHPQWGTLIYDYGKGEVRSFLISSAMFWLQHYHFDGLRVDAVSSMLYLGFGRDKGDWMPNKEGGEINLEAKSLLQQLNVAVHRLPGVLTFAEESTAYPAVTGSVQSGGLGFDFKWNMGWMNDTLRYVATDPYFRPSVHDKMTFGMVYAYDERFVLALSHDEVVHGKCSLLSKQPGYYLDKFGGLMTYLGFAMAHPGKKLFFMGYELGQFVEWDFRKGLDWCLLDYPTHRGLHRFAADLNAFYLAHPALWQLDYVREGFRWLADDPDRNLLAMARFDKAGEMVIAVCNFSPKYYARYALCVPQEGEYQVELDSTHATYGFGDTPMGCRYHTHREDTDLPHILLDVKPNSVQYLTKCAKEGNPK